MVEPVRDGDFFARRAAARDAAAPIGERQPAQIEPPKIAHYRGMRPMTTTAPAKPIRVTREEIEAALGFTYNPATEEIIDRIVLETARMDGFADNSPPAKEHQQTVLRLLREIGLYPI